MAAGIAAVAIGIIGGGLALGRSLEHAERDRELRERFGTPPRDSNFR